MKVLGGLLAATLLACSSSSEEAACPFEGTYTFTSMVQSGMCTPAADAGAQSSNTVATATVSYRQGLWYIQLAGASGGCIADQVANSCKLQTQCPVQITDATDPTNAVGTIQYSWSFTSAGFTGLTSVSFPPAKSIPDGCSITETVTGTRQ